MIGKFSIEWILKVAGVATLILAGFGKFAATFVGADPNATGIVGSIAFGIGLYLAAPIVGDLLKKPS